MVVEPGALSEFVGPSSPWFCLFSPLVENLLNRNYQIIINFLFSYFLFSLQSAVAWKRFILVFGGGLFALFGSKAAEFPGAGALGCLILAFVAAQGWQRNTVLLSVC